MVMKGPYVHGILKFLLIVFNALLWFAGLILLCLSVWLYFYGEHGNYLQGSSESYKYFTSVYILMGAGALMTLVGCLGCLGAILENRCMLAAFFIFLFTICAAEITGGVWAWLHKDQVDAGVKDHVRTMVIDYGHNPVITETIDLMQRELECCGVDRPSDWRLAHVNTNGTVDVGVPSYLYVVPKTCCQAPDDDATCDVRRYIRDLDSAPGGIYQQGCADALSEQLKDHMNIVVGIGIGFSIFQVLGLILSLSMCCAIRHGRDGYIRA